jgi:glutamyl/glutaminyl-tRNA synthetase
MDFVRAMIEDMHWLGLRWEEGPDCGGPFGPYNQSERGHFYVDAFSALRSRGWVYPCRCTRKDILRSLHAPHAGDEEPIYPGTCRPPASAPFPEPPTPSTGTKVSWRFRVPDGEAIEFVDGCFGQQSFVAGTDFGDFLVWRHDNLPSYQLSVVVDDATMGITEVVRGADLLLSTARQILLYRALGLQSPAFYHCPLMTDEAGVRLAKRHDALSLRRMREQGMTPEEVRARFEG